jgi:hypothetical protein
MKRRSIFIFQVILFLSFISAASVLSSPAGTPQVSIINVWQGDAGEAYLPLLFKSLPITPTATPSVTPTPTPTNTPQVTETRTPSPSEVIQFTDGYGGDVFTAKDMLMSSGWPTDNGGVHTDFQLDGPPGAEQQAMLEFNLSSLPADAVIHGAWLYLYHSYDPEGGVTVECDVYSVAAANASWIAGTGNIDLALEGEPCWNALEADGAGGVKTAWAGSAGCSSSGTDYEATAIGSFSFDPHSAKGTEIIISLNTARVQDWVGAVNTNYGIIIISTAGHGHVGQSNHPTTAYRPKLVVHYTSE